MYKLKLVGPNEGKTIRIRDYQFINGYCLVSSVPQNLIKYYGCVVEEENGLQNEEIKETEEEVTSPQEKQDVVHESDVSINNEQEDKMNEQELLQEIVKAKKEELEKKADAPKYKTQADFPNWFQYRAYVKEISGKIPKNKAQAEEIMAGLE